MAIYTNNVPQANQQISATQPTILGNFGYLPNMLNKDHDFSNNNSNATDGYHKLIHMETASTPSLISGIQQLYTRLAGSNTQLFSMNDAGQISRLTGHLAAASGYQYVGGIIIQWGNVLFSASTSVTFPKSDAFTNCWVVCPTLVFTGAISGGNTYTVGIVSQSPTGFVWTGNRFDAKFVSFNYIAIGS